MLHFLFYFWRGWVGKSLSRTKLVKYMKQYGDPSVTLPRVRFAGR